MAALGFYKLYTHLRCEGILQIIRAHPRILNVRYARINSVWHIRMISDDIDWANRVTTFRNVSDKIHAAHYNVRFSLYLTSISGFYDTYGHIP